MTFGIVRLYCGKSGRKGFYNVQELGLARAMKKIGYTVIIFVPEKDAILPKKEDIESGVLMVMCPAKTIGVHSRFDWNVIKQFKVNILQIGSDNQIFAPSLIKFCDANNILIYNYIGTIKTDSKNIFKSIFMKIMFFGNLNAYKRHMNFVKTKKVGFELSKYGVGNIKLLPVGLDVSVIPYISESKGTLKMINKIEEDKKIVLFVGRFDEYKRPFMMVELIQDLPECYQGIMIGDGALSNAIDKKIKTEGLSNRVIHIKSMPNVEIHKYYKMADYFVNFNENEIFGMSILEAMYQGCNVIAYHAAGPDEIIEDGISGWLVDSKEEIVMIIKTNKKLKPEVIKDRINKEFNYDKIAQNINNWIEEKRLTVGA